MGTLSVVIMAYNDEGKMQKALESIKDLADEIIVVDNSSTDNTVKIAKRYTDKIFTQKNDPLNIDLQKNFGFGKATKDWTLTIDPDEIVTPELAQEIKEILRNSDNKVAYWIPRKNTIFGKQIQHTGWYPDYQLRLFISKKGKYINEEIHGSIAIEGEKGYLHTDLLHLNYETIEQFINRNLLHYAKSEAEIKLKSGYSFSYKDAIWLPFQEFLSRYFAREGYKDGFHGLVLSLLMAAYHLAVFGYLWEANKFTTKDFSLVEFKHITEEIKIETNYWVISSEINQEKNPIKKTVLKIKRKVR